ncbi:hypothetical protein [Bacillus sonorensis]|uniref:hypothetical protein n=1 Tax=Bacillus sonorensis TaxID=119858 RepID=UPI00098B588B|nr:hypothetical protein [Bacillus sonorensis]
MEFSETVKQQLVTSKSRKLIKFIRKEFPAEGQSYSGQIDKYEALKQLDDNDLSSGIARMTRIETSFDNSKNAAFLVMIFNLAIGVFKLLTDAGVELNNITEKFAQGLNATYGLIATIFAGIIFGALLIDKNKVTTASYFKTLLEQAKGDRETEKKSSSPKTRSDNRIEVNVQTGWLFWKKDNYKQAKDLDEILLNWSDIEIISYISANLGYRSTKDKKAELQRIRGLNLDTIILAIASMKEIEETYDNSKIIPGFSAGFVLIVTQSAILYRYMNSPLWGSFGGVFLAFLVYYFLIKGIWNGRNLRSRAVKYKSLLEQVKSEMEKTS